MTKFLVYVILFFSSSIHATQKNTETINGLTYQMPSTNSWAVEKEKYDTVQIINWSTTQWPKKELSIVVEQKSKQDIHGEKYLKKMKQMLPYNTVTSEPLYTYDFGQDTLIINFTIPFENYTLFGKKISTYANGYLYEIIISRYYKEIENDEELMNLLNSIKFEIIE